MNESDEINGKIIELVDDVLGEKYYRIKHKSGISVYVLPKKTTSKTALLGVNFGSFYEHGADDFGKKLNFSSGIAHYLEHKLFSNKGDIDAVEELAALGADANAYTSNSRTVYMFSCMENFNSALEALVGFVTDPYFTDENVESERGIIKQEIKMSLDSPYDVVIQNLLLALYGENQISTDTLGTEKTVSEIDADMLYECYDAFYGYSNMTLVACGDIEPSDVIDVLDRCLPKRKARSLPTFPKFQYGRAVEMPYIEKIMPVSIPVFEIGIKDRHPSSNSSERLRRDVTMGVLGEIIFSQTGELYNELFDDGYINESYSYGYSNTREAAFYSVYGEGNDPMAVLEAIKRRISEMKRDGISERDFIRCKRVALAEFIRNFDFVDDLSNLTLNMTMDGLDLFDFRKTIEELTLEDVESCLNDSFDEECFAISVIKNS